MIQKTSEDNFKAFVKEIKEKIMDFAGKIDGKLAEKSENFGKV